MALPFFRYLDCYFVVSEIEFIQEVKDNCIILQKKGWVAGKSTKSSGYIRDLAIVLKAKIINEIYGLPPSTWYDYNEYLIQLSMYKNLQKSLDWYKKFYENPRYLLEYIKNNLQFMLISPKWCPYKFEETFEITRLEIKYGINYNFSTTFWFQNIENASECYIYETVFDQHRKKEKILAYAIAWNNRQLERKAENKKNRKEKAIIAKILDSWKSTIPFTTTENLDSR